MKKSYIITALIAASAALFGGCSREEAAAIPGRERVEVKMRGSVSNSREVVIPDANGLPKTQLVVGILTGNYNLRPEDYYYLYDGVHQRLRIHPQEEDWGSYTYLDRGIFGNADQATNPGSEIKYTTSEEPYNQQRVFYDESGMYYIMRIIYPYTYKYRPTPDAALVETQPQLLLSASGSQVAFDMDGHQDILSSDLGWGNMDSGTEEWGEELGKGLINTENPTNGFVFTHHLTRFELWVKAEAAAIAQYGQIEAIELVNQPNKVVLDITSNKLSAGSEWVSRYKPNGFAPLYLTTAEQACGQVMALPGGKFTFRIKTENRLSFYIDAEFPAYTRVEGEDLVEVPAGARAGSYYKLTFAFKAADEVELIADTPKDWYNDSYFD